MPINRRALVLSPAALLAASKLPAMAECATGYTQITVPACQLTPLFHDDFTSLDMTTSSHVGVWRPNDFWQNINAGYEDFAGFSWNLNPNDTTTGISPFSISGSVLTIKIIKTPSSITSAIQAEMTTQGIPGSVPPWCGGMLVTNPAVNKFKYGYFEIKARFPTEGNGMFPALWFYATDGSSDPLGKGTAEIDMLEVFGVPNVEYTNTHPVPTGAPQIGTYSQNITGWHLYGMDWQPTYIKFYFDNTLLYSLTGTSAAYFNTTMGIRMNYSVNASWFSQMTDGTTPDPMTMDIDYVSVWATKP